MTFSRIGSAALLVAMAAGCSLLPGAGGTPDVAGRDFLSTSITVGGVEQPLESGTRIRIGFSDDGILSANAGCNHFGAMYQISGGVLAITGASMTEMGCEPALAEQDEWLFTFLGSQPAVATSGDELTLTEGDTVIVLLDREVADPDLPLSGPVWTVTGVVDQDAVSSLPEGVTSTMFFGDDGLVTVNTGCNTGNGAYEALSETIRFGPVALTRMACEGPAAQMEAAMLRILNADVVRYQIEARSLELSIAGEGLNLESTPLD